MKNPFKNPFKKIVDFFTEFFDLFQEEEEIPEFEIPKKWRRRKSKSGMDSVPTTEQTTKIILTKVIPEVPTSISPKYKIKVPYLRKIKKYLAAVLLLINVSVGLLSLGFQPLLGLLFLGNAFIILDFLWKVRRKKVYET